ncbi:MAG: lysophospholipid acyltransferase family protein [Oligoflexia bacterium]|nr:lysophospholipid acyltransferase family protein [Oligoflexia bacterium]
MKFIKGLFTVVILAITILVANFIQVLSVLLLPISTFLTRFINRFCSKYWFNLKILLLKKIQGIEFIYTGDKLSISENAFVICNHQTMSDIPALLSLAYEYGRCGDTKWFVKDPLKWVPGVGWGLFLMDNLFVKRNWAADKEKIFKIFKRLRESKQPYWVISFLEGTRKTPKKLERSQQYAKKTGEKPLQNLLFPRTKGFVATLSGLDNTLDAVYFFLIGYPSAPPPLKMLFFGDVKKIHLHAERVLKNQIPDTEEAQEKWIIEKFHSLDQKMGSFLERGHF